MKIDIYSGLILLDLVLSWKFFKNLSNFFVEQDITEWDLLY